MKNFLLAAILLYCISFTSTHIPHTSHPQIDFKPLIDSIFEPLNEIKEFKSHSKFLFDLGYFESRNNYEIVNKWGYLGKYQFSPATLKSLGFNTTAEHFLSNPELQEEAMNSLLKANYKSLKKYIKKFEGKVVHGVKITKSGVLAAAHLGGAGNVKNWFENGIDFEDNLGTSITHYMKTFSDYSLDIR